MDPDELGGEFRDTTAFEDTFVDQLNTLHAGLDYWLHRDPDGTPWLLVSLDLVPPGTNGIVATWRVDVDQAGVVGGLSPACLNWDDGVRARAARIDVEGPQGLVLEPSPDLASHVAEWFAAREVDGWR